MKSEAAPQPASSHHLLRRFGLLQATALNMSNMIGVGPFITIPALMSALGGPQSMLGWFIALLIAVPDGMVWSELGAAMPGSGGSYHYLREAFGRATIGRLMAFLFIWQFILSGPLEIASGCIGFAHYLGYLFPALTQPENVRLAQLVAAGVAAMTVALLYRRITTIGKITVSLWVGTLVTVGAVIVSGALHFNPRLAFDFPPGAFKFSWGFLLGLGAASRVGIYDYLGYYDVCYIGEEVKSPGRVIPRSILISLAAVALIYFAINLSLIGVVPWREFVPAKDPPDAVASMFMEKLYGAKVAGVFTVMVLWTAVGSVFALMLGYSRIPYAAAQNGDFFKVFGRLHPTKDFPHISLLVIGLVSIVCSFLPLMTVIDALLITRIIVQFMGQVVAVMLLRRRAPALARPYRIWLYPVPCFVALVGWLFVFGTADWKVILFGLGTLLLGVIIFLIWSKWTRRWPCAMPPAGEGSAAI
ncbi:MAG: amino acid permease [Verrucomicrobia subdivision 3 bacterium]|nr:amino acid permease [Limisphaerales bacterium]